MLRFKKGENMDNLDLKPKIKSKKNLLYKVIKTIVLLGIIIGLSFIANKFVLKPYRYRKLADETKNLYYNEDPILLKIMRIILGIIMILSKTIQMLMTFKNQRIEMKKVA